MFIRKSRKMLPLCILGGHIQNSRDYLLYIVFGAHGYRIPVFDSALLNFDFRDVSNTAAN